MVYNFFDKKTSCGAIKTEVMQNEEIAKEYTNQLLENLKKEKYTYLLYTIFGALILQVCNWSVNLIKDLDFYYVLLIFM